MSFGLFDDLIPDPGQEPESDPGPEPGRPPEPDPKPAVLTPGSLFEDLIPTLPRDTPSLRPVRSLSETRGPWDPKPKVSSAPSPSEPLTGERKAAHADELAKEREFRQGIEEDPEQRAASDARIDAINRKYGVTTLGGMGEPRIDPGRETPLTDGPIDQVAAGLHNALSAGIAGLSDPMNLLLGGAGEAKALASPIIKTVFGGLMAKGALSKLFYFSQPIHPTIPFGQTHQYPSLKRCSLGELQ